MLDCPVWGSPYEGVRSKFDYGRFLVGFRVRLGDLGWEMVIPCNHVIQCRLAPLPLPCVLLLYVGVPSSAAEEVFKFIVGHSYVLIKRLCIVPPATRMCTVQVTLHNYVFFSVWLSSFPLYSTFQFAP